MLVRVERDTGRVSMLSIPRDLWVTYAGGGEGRINGAYAVGEKRYGPGGGPARVASRGPTVLRLDPQKRRGRRRRVALKWEFSA